MTRGDVVLVCIPHPSGQRGKKRPAVVVQSDAYAGTVGTIVVAEVTKNLTMKGDPACLFIDVSTPEGILTGLFVDSVVSSLVLNTVYTDTVAQVARAAIPFPGATVGRLLESGAGAAVSRAEPDATPAVGRITPLPRLTSFIRVVEPAT
jgi:mRNA-degrading endonuclease toxin of MazEF toxin-antitoxin module